MEPMRDQTKLKRFVETARNEYLICRVWQHEWPDRGTVETSGSEILWTKTCMRCTARKTLHIRRTTGEYLRASYQYPLGYLIPGGFGLDAKERGAIRLELIQRGG